MLFNISNPSDPYIMRAVDLEIAAVAVSVLGHGKYMLEEIGGDRSGLVPAFLFGGHDEWFTKQFGRDFAATLQHVMDNRQDELVKALASVFCGTPADKIKFDELAAKCQDEEAYATLLLSTHDAKRTSTNDIGRQAWDMARQMTMVQLVKAEALAVATEQAATATIQ